VAHKILIVKDTIESTIRKIDFERLDIAQAEIQEIQLFVFILYISYIKW